MTNMIITPTHAVMEISRRAANRLAHDAGNRGVSASDFSGLEGVATLVVGLSGATLRQIASGAALSIPDPTVGQKVTRRRGGRSTAATVAVSAEPVTQTTLDARAAYKAAFDAAPDGQKSAAGRTAYRKVMEKAAAKAKAAAPTS